VKKVLIVLLLFTLLLSACDALGIGEPTPAPPPADASVEEVGYLSKVIIQLENAYGGDYRVTIGGVEFSCRTYEDHPDQLYCFGPELPRGQHEALVYSGDQEEPLFKLAVNVSGNEVVVTATSPPATDTPLPPTATPTLAVSSVPTEDISTPGAPPATIAPTTPADIPTATLAPDEAIKVYYFKLDEAGRFGCGEAMYWVKSSQRITESMADNISYGLRFLFSYHQPYFGELYNPYGASDNQFAVGSIEFIDETSVNVYLTGYYNRSDKECDPTRLRDQIKQIILQFQGVNQAFVYLNGVRIEDAFQRK
jgi:hypothetical protein